MRPLGTSIGIGVMVGALSVCGVGADAARAAPPKSGGAGAGQRIQATLVAEHDAIVPGQTTTIGVVLEIERGWYTYWKNPGETGFEMGVDFAPAPGLSFSEPIWPAPKRKVLPGGMLDYVYTDRVAVLFEVSADQTLEAGAEIRIEAHASWLVCKESCILEDADLSLTLPVQSARGDGAGADVIRSTQAHLPSPLTERDGVFARLRDQTLQIRAAGASTLTFYPDYQEGVEAQDMIGDGESKGGTLDIRYSSLGEDGAVSGVLGVQRMGRTTYYLIEAKRDG